jgi:dienelactone hydrolase
VNKTFLRAATVLFAMAVQANSADLTTFPYEKETREALECRPEGPGPFPTVVYSHGSIVDAVGVAGAREKGNELDVICAALAKEGFVAFFPIREKINPGRHYADYQPYYKDIVNAAIDHLKTQPYVDSRRITLMGHSMGGTVTLIVAQDRKDLKAIVVSAPASKNRVFGSTVHYAGALNVPVLLMIERSDFSHIHAGVNALERALKNHNKTYIVRRYEGGGGHALFFTVDYYWPDVIEFLRKHG